MLKLILSIAGGLVVAFLIVFGSDALFHALVPAAAAMPDASDRAAMDAYMTSLPTGVLAGLALSWALAALVGSWLAARFAARGEWPGWVVGGLFLAATGVNFAMVTHPMWMIALAVVTVIAATWIGARVGSRRT